MLGNSDRALYWEMKSDFAIITEIDGARIFTKEGIFLLRAFIGITFDFGSWNEECIALKLFKCMNNIDYLATNEPFNDFSIDEIEEGLIGLNDATLFFTKFKQRQSLLLAISRLHLIIPIPKDDGSEESEKLIQLRNFDQFAEQISILRICEIMNHQPFNILITYAELKALTIPNLLKRLCNRSLHFEALRIANFMGIDTSFISAHWANCLIRTKLSPREINEKLLEMKGQIDLIGLAMTAFLIQKEEIAFKLLDLCSTKSRCVPILLNQKNWNECLEYSILSEDSSLMAYTFEEVNKYDKKSLRKITSKNEISFNLMLDILKVKEKMKYLIENDDAIPILKCFLEENIIDKNIKKLLKKNNKNIVQDTFKLYLATEKIKKWLRRKKQGIDSPLLKTSIKETKFFSNIIKKAKVIKEDIEKTFKEKFKFNKQNNENNETNEQNIEIIEKQNNENIENNETKEENVEIIEKQNEENENKAKENIEKSNEEKEPTIRNTQIKDEYDLMTPLELFEQVVLSNDERAINDCKNILEMTNEEFLFKKLHVAIKFDKMEIIKQIIKEANSVTILEMLHYCRDIKNSKAVDYLKGLDPDSKKMRKK